MVEVVVTDEFTAWYYNLEEVDSDAVFRVVEILKERGIALGFPLSSEINGSKYALRELRVQSRGRPLRVLYAFDPMRQAVLLLGGDKSKKGDRRFYSEFIAAAERLWEEYLRATGVERK